MLCLLTEVWHPGAGRHQGHQELLVGEVEGHGQLAQPRQPRRGPGDQLPRDPVHADDEEPLGEPPQQVEEQSGPVPVVVVEDANSGVDRETEKSWKYKNCIPWSN